jgi:heptosyltransferase-2
VLVVRLDEIGDVVLSSPFLRELRRGLPTAEIDLVVKRDNVDLVANCPYVDRVFGIAVSKHTYFGRLFRQWSAVAAATGPLRGRRYDLALVPRWDSDYFYNAAAVAYLAGARWRMGQRERMAAHRQSDSLYTTLVDNPSVQHEVERNLDLLRALGINPTSSRLECWITEREEARVSALLGQNGIAANSSILAIAPSASHARKRWPKDNFAKLLEWAETELAANILLVGGPADTALAESISRNARRPVLNLAGRTSLIESAAVLKRARLFVGNDSGPLHLAAACGVPTVGIWCHPITGSPHHSQSPTRFGPWANSNQVVQPARGISPCTISCEAEDSHCIQNVSVMKVMQVVKRLFDSSSSSSR